MLTARIREARPLTRLLAVTVALLLDVGRLLDTSAELLQDAQLLQGLLGSEFLGRPFLPSGTYAENLLLDYGRTGWLVSECGGTEYGEHLLRQVAVHSFLPPGRLIGSSFQERSASRFCCCRSVRGR